MNLLICTDCQGAILFAKLDQETLNLEIDEKVKLDLIKLLAEVEYRLSQGASEEIQLNAMIELKLVCSIRAIKLFTNPYFLSIFALRLLE